MRVAACLAILAAAPLSTGVSQGQQGGSGMQYPMKDTSSISPLSRPSDPNPGLDETQSPADSRKQLDALNTLRQKEMTADTAKLLALATELKADMDKTSKDTLSLEVVRKAEQIEKLAHSVREKMKATIGK